MTARIVTWTHDMLRLGAATVAIGVFDGVHIGHQALLRDTVADARAHGVRSVAITFDRDPDQVVSPQTAAPQLLTLRDKLECIRETGVDVILVVPFTTELAEMAPEAFVDSVLIAALRPVTVHVGRDFHFGVRATGDVGTLQRLGLTHSFEVHPHELVTFEGSPVTSTRIRALVAAGDVEAAGELLCRKATVSGIVKRGRGEGVALGFPTANIEPMSFAALPADGVYAGRAILEDGVKWAAAISVGTPPMFPQARDYLEAHLIAFDGDLYEQSVTLEFWSKLRDLRTFSGVEELTAAIAADVESSLEIAGFDDDELQDSDGEGAPYEDSDDEDGAIIEDPAALTAAEAEVAAFEDDNRFAAIDGAWAELLTRITFIAGPDTVANAFAIVSPLDAAGIPYAWSPYAPGDRPSATRGAYQSQYTLYVPEVQLAEACEALVEAQSPYVSELPQYEPTAVQTAGTGESGIDDPAALEAAEEAVRRFDDALPARPVAPMPAGWTALAHRMPYDKQRLGAISYGLAAAGIPADWDPFEPDEAPLMRLFTLHETKFDVRVPKDDIEAAREILGEVDARFSAGNQGG